MKIIYVEFLLINMQKCLIKALRFSSLARKSHMKVSSAKHPPDAL